MFDINLELKKLPHSPGVYIMKNKFRQIIYVGKAVNLKRRVSQYFKKSVSHSKKVEAMVKNIASFEYTITDNELEALILECSLIKQNRPRYNILLKDDKTYPYIRIDLKSDYPSVQIVHRHKKDNAKYFGPYQSSIAVKNTLELIYKIWPVRRCKQKFVPNRKRPCLNYFIKQCKAPCCNLISIDEYKTMIGQIIKFLEGDCKNIIKNLREQMDKCAEELKFEKAINLRDKIFALEQISQRQKIETSNSNDCDVIGFSRDGDCAIVKIFFLRDGRIINQSHFILRGVAERNRSDILSEFVKQFYTEQTSVLPKEIVVDQLTDKEIIEQYLSKLAQRNVKIICPQKGDRYKLLLLASKNANMILERQKSVHTNFQDEFDGFEKFLQCVDLQQYKLNKLEAYDISNIQGTNCVGAMIRINRQGFDKKNYRRYKIKTVEGQNDYESMCEVISRRIKYGDLPDLFLIDGGRGHVNCVIQLMDKLGFRDVKICGMVKNNKHKTKSIFYCGREIILPRQILNFIEKVQDQVHHFAIDYHRRLRRNNMGRSILDGIKNVGPKRKSILLSHFGSIEKIINASVEELAKVEGVSMQTAKNIYDALEQYRQL